MSPTRRLPEGWSAPESVEDTIVADGLAIRRAGVASVSPEGEEITGSAAALDGPGAGSVDLEPASRAWFELLERASIVEAMLARRSEYELKTLTGSSARTCSHRELFPESDAPSRWRYGRSNGVAIHGDWTRACERAFWELAERDRVLASWHGHVRPRRIEGAPSGVGELTSSYDWSAWALPEESAASFSHGIEVVAVIGFPTRSDVPLALGFAARPDRRAALDAATREAIQFLGFLWGEPVSDIVNDVEPTAMGHLDFYQGSARHPLLRSWLAGDHVRYAETDPRVVPGGAERQEVVFADLTPPWLDGGLRVVKAVCEAARPLVFGDAPHGAHLPSRLRFHPIS